MSSIKKDKKVTYSNIIIHSHTKIINMITDQLCLLFICDYDVAQLIAENYVSLRMKDHIDLSRTIIMIE